jgi:deazaflavin-dependent oxidoreductase (nitroreductase family)
MANWNERNPGVIEEFRKNRDSGGGNPPARPLLLLTTTGARSGLQRINPLMYLKDGDRWVIFASKGGAPAHPDWYHNLVANPTVTLEVGVETFEADATVAAGEERDTLYARQAQQFPMFGDYEKKAAGRQIPVVVLTRRR